jgi:alpha-galactosidase
MSDIIDRMVNEFGCDYIKFDGCPNAGMGTEVDSLSLGDGLEKAMDAFLNWTKDMMNRYPNVLFEDCAGGGQRTDYKALSMFHLLSTSDQMNYQHYPYIVGNIFCSVIPEQAGVWSYPVDSNLFDPNNPEATDSKVTKERVVLNMVNAILGRIHLASRIHLLSEDKQALVGEGVEYYNSITQEKLQAVPYLPKGYTTFGDTFVSCGLKTEQKVYLAVWNLNGEKNVKLPLPEIKAQSVRVAYPSAPLSDFTVSLIDNTLDIRFTEDEQARILEITL